MLCSSCYCLIYCILYLSIYLSFYLQYLFIYLSFCISVYLFILLYIYLFILLSICLSIYPSTYLYVYLFILLSIYFPSIYLFSFYLSVYLSISAPFHPQPNYEFPSSSSLCSEPCNQQFLANKRQIYDVWRGEQGTTGSGSSWYVGAQPGASCHAHAIIQSCISA